MSTVSEAFEEFLLARAVTKPSPASVKAWRADIAAIGKLIGEQQDVVWEEFPVDQIDAHVVRRAFAAFAADHAASSIARAHSSWNVFLDFCVADDLIAGNPMAGVPKPRQPRRVPKPLPDDSVDRLIKVLGDGTRPARFPWPELDAAVIVTGLITGLRLDELCGLNIGSITGRTGERRFVVRGKGDKERVVPFEEALEAVLEKYLRSRIERFGADSVDQSSPLFVSRHNQRLTHNAVQYLVRSCYRAAGIDASRPPGALVHALRHTFATRLADDGASATEIQLLLGHSSITTSQGYIDATATQTRAAAKANRTYQALDHILDTPEPELGPGRSRDVV